MDSNLVEALVGIQADEVEATIRVTQVFNGINAAGYWVLEGQCLGI